MNFGLPDNVLRMIRICFAEFADVKWVKIFGSRALGTQKNSSDIDLAFSADINHSGEIKSILEALPTPYLFDVVHYESLRNENIIEHIDTKGIAFYTKPDDSLLHYFKNLIHILGNGIIQSISLETLPEHKRFIYGMSLKVFADCDAAQMLLLTDGLSNDAYLAQALILLRSAFESAVIANYFVLSPDSFEEYKLKGLIAQLKDMLASKNYGRNISDNLILGLQTHICELPLFKESGISLDDLNDADKLIHYAKNKDIHKIVDQLIKGDPEAYVFLKEMNFDIYNTGSQLIHSIHPKIWEYYLSSRNPTLNVKAMFNITLIILDLMLKALDKSQLLRLPYRELKEYFHQFEDAKWMMNL